MEQVEGADCNPAYAVCLDHKNTAALIRNVDQLQSYVDEAWALCGTPPAEPVK